MGGLEPKVSRADDTRSLGNKPSGTNKVRFRKQKADK